MTEKQLVFQIKLLKEIKPNQEWAVLLKSQILAEPVKTENWEIGKFIEGWKLIIENSFSRKLAYSFAAFLFIFIGLIGFAQYTVPGDLLFPIKKIAEQSEAALSGKSGLKQNTAVLNSRIKDLAQVAKEGKTSNMPSAISEIKANITELTRTLKENPIEDVDTLKEIATSLKTLADVPGTDLDNNENIRDLYETIVVSQIVDLEKSTLIEEQQKVLEEIKDLFEQGRYSEALEKILLLNN